MDMCVNKAYWRYGLFMNYVIQVGGRPKEVKRLQTGGGAHWALEHRDVILTKFGKFENWPKVIMFDVKQHS